MMEDRIGMKDEEIEMMEEETGMKEDRIEMKEEEIEMMENRIGMKEEETEKKITQQNIMREITMIIKEMEMINHQKEEVKDTVNLISVTMHKTELRNNKKGEHQFHLEVVDHLKRKRTKTNFRREKKVSKKITIILI